MVKATTNYTQMLSLLQQEALTVQEYKEKVSEFIKRAETAVPQLFWQLVKEFKKEQDYKEDEDEDGKIIRQLYNECRDRIMIDCLKVWATSTIRDALPPEAKDPVKAEAGRKGRQKQLEVLATTGGAEVQLHPAQDNQHVGSFGEIGPETYDERVLGIKEASNTMDASPHESHQHDGGQDLESQVLVRNQFLEDEVKRLQAENAKLTELKLLSTSEGELRRQIDGLNSKLAPFSKDDEIVIRGNSIPLHIFVQPDKRIVEVSIDEKKYKKLYG